MLGVSLDAKSNNFGEISLPLKLSSQCQIGVSYEVCWETCALVECLTQRLTKVL